MALSREAISSGLGGWCLSVPIQWDPWVSSQNSFSPLSPVSLWSASSKTRRASAIQRSAVRRLTFASASSCR